MMIIKITYLFNDIEKGNRFLDRNDCKPAYQTEELVLVYASLVIV